MQNSSCHISRASGSVVVLMTWHLNTLSPRRRKPSFRASEVPTNGRGEFLLTSACGKGPTFLTERLARLSGLRLACGVAPCVDHGVASDVHGVKRPSQEAGKQTPAHWFSFARTPTIPAYHSALVGEDLANPGCFNAREHALAPVVNLSPVGYWRKRDHTRSVQGGLYGTMAIRSLLPLNDSCDLTVESNRHYFDIPKAAPSSAVPFHCRRRVYDHFSVNQKRS